MHAESLPRSSAAPALPSHGLAAPFLRGAVWVVLLGAVPLALGLQVLDLWNWDLSVPLVYVKGDDIWQLALTKVLTDTGWVLTNPYLGAPEVAHWHHNAAAQTSALHSVLMLALSRFIDDPVRVQQIYYLLNFPLICTTAFVACRSLGIARLPAFCVGLLFAFTTFRIQALCYAYLVNYFMVPLALMVVMWILTGRFTAGGRAPGGWRRTAGILRSRAFVAGLAIIALTAASDGYYAFFTLLLLGFATFVRVVAGDWRQPSALVPAGAYMVVLLAVALLLQVPLNEYKDAHRDEFYPADVEDPVLVKHPFEAEVYSSSLKLMIAPIPNHRVASLGAIGARMVDSVDQAKRYARGAAIVPLGLLGTAILVVILTRLAVPVLGRRGGGGGARGARRQTDATPRRLSLDEAAVSLVLFIFLCAIAGGIGTLVALVFPTIRAYDRFPLFLLFVLYLSAAWFVTHRLRRTRGVTHIALIALVLLVTAGALYDQTPRGIELGREQIRERFLAERLFVRKLEASLPSGAMVYQYPYSQYLRESKYYGWGAFSHIRLYLHSRDLRWSNGGAKNSPADDWLFRIAQRPFDRLVAEVEAVGFDGLVIDRAVVAEDEYRQIRIFFSARGDRVDEDEASGLAFVRLRDPGFRLDYDARYENPDRLVLTDPGRIAWGALPEAVDGEALRRFLGARGATSGLVVARADHPEVFRDLASIRGRLGLAAIRPASALRGRLTCRFGAGSAATSATPTLLLTLTNQERFDWKLDEGSFPIRIGMRLLRPDGALVRWDNRFRVPAQGLVAAGASQTIPLPVSALPLTTAERAAGPLLVEFVLVQDGNAWFDDIACRLPLP